MSDQGGAATRARQRHGWLELVATSGPFLTLPVAERVFPNGVPRVPTPLRGHLRGAVEMMLDQPLTQREQVVHAVLCDLLDWGPYLVRGTDLPESLAEPVSEHHTIVRPDFAFVVDEDDDEAVDDDGEDEVSDPYRMLGIIMPWNTHPFERWEEGSWTASGIERLAVLLRARGVPVGLVTDGRWWAIVWAPVGGTTGAAVFDASLWSEEAETLAAYASLLDRTRFLGVARGDTLPAMLAESLDNAEEVTEQLSTQVREAVELLVLTLDRLDDESNNQLLADVDDDAFYAGVVAIMMRIVFLLFAEERSLLRSDTHAYSSAYSIGRLVEQLEQRAALYGEQTLEHRTGAWHRLLAISRAVHGGIAHEDLRMPAYGGGLFDPDRHAWLEGRSPDAPVAASNPPAVDDRTVMRMLQAVQYVDVGGERRRLTFRALDVEQIGYVYEGLLELEVRTAEEVVLQLRRPSEWPKLKDKAEPPEVPASVVREWPMTYDESFGKELTQRTGLTQKRLEKALDDDVDEGVRAHLSLAIGGDTVLVEMAANIEQILRYDERKQPVITQPGRRYLGASTRRATTGTHYTPRWLAEDVVHHALEPLCYRPGPLETSEKETWRIRPSTEILDLRVADIAMGSGAFLVAACRYLAARLVEAWDAEGRADATTVLAVRDGRATRSDVEVDVVELDARRLVAEHCLYGVDINPLAVDMAKLSLWLITMDDERPFGFLDDRLVCGDSLLGLVSWPQLREVHVDPTVGQRRETSPTLDLTGDWRIAVQQAADLRRRITAAPVVTIRDVEHKQRLLAEATATIEPFAAIADAITAKGLETASIGSESKRDQAFQSLRVEVSTALGDADEKQRLSDRARKMIQEERPDGTDFRRPFHWPLAFPEVLVDEADKGFDAIVGNPPFLGGQKHREAFGDDYRKWLQRWDGFGAKGSADLAARFVLRARRLLNHRGQLGFITTNTLVEGATLEVGMLQAVERGLHMRAGRSSRPWPSRSASLEIVHMWASLTSPRQGVPRELDDEEIPALGPDLQPVGRVKGRPQVLPDNDGLAFQGSNVLGTGFTMPPEQAADLIRRDQRNAAALQPYVTGRDLNQRPDCSASRWVINFKDWTLDRAEAYSDLMAIVRKDVKPFRDRNRNEARRKLWWRFTRPAPELYEAVENLNNVLCLARVSSVVLPVRVPTGPVYNEKCVVFATDSYGALAELSSNVHQTWVIRYTSTLETRINYSPSDVFDTFPRPSHTAELETLGEQLDRERRELMLGRGWGLTTTYNHVHDPNDSDPQVVRLREMHAAIDHAVLAAYGWDLDPEIGHHKTKIGIRWTFSPAARFELLDLLLEENHRRARILV